jgi:Cation transporter/ATPase, N-terminus
MAVPDVLATLDSGRAGLTAAEAARRLRMLGPNAVRSHGARAFPVLGRQLRSPLLILLLLAALGAVTLGALLPATPLARTLAFQPLPGLFFVARALMAACYLALIEIGKRLFYHAASAGPAIRHRHPGYRLLRRAARFTTVGSLPAGAKRGAV